MHRPHCPFRVSRCPLSVMPSAPTVAADTPSNPPPRPRARGWPARLGRWLILFFILAPSVLGLLWLVLQWGILPRIDHWRPWVEQRATEALGRPLRIGAISTQGGRAWQQELRIERVQLFDAQGQVALELPSLRATVSPASLLHWPPRLTLLELEAPRLDIRRDPAGRLWIGGLALADGRPAAAAPADDRLADWLLRLPLLRIVGGQLRWHDEARGAPPLSLDRVDLNWQNGVRHHALRIDASPPADWGERFSLRADWTRPLLLPLGDLGEDGRLLAAPTDWRRWRGSLHVDLPRADVQRLSRHLSLPVDLQRGDGALRAWFDFADGRAEDLTLDLALDTVTLRLAPELAPLDLRRVRGRLRALDGPQGGRMSLENFAFETAEGEPWPASTTRLDWRYAALAPGAGGPAGLASAAAAASASAASGATAAAAPAPAAVLSGAASVATATASASGAAASSAPAASDAPAPDLLFFGQRPLAGGALSLSQVDLARLRGLAARLPLPPNWQQALDALAPEGELRDLALRWDGRLAAPDRLQFEGRAEGLALAAQALPLDPLGRALLAEGSWLGRPGFRGLSGQFKATESGGQASLSMRDGRVELPGVFAEPALDLPQLDARLDWQREASGWRVDFSELDLRTPDWKGHVNGRWRRGDFEQGPGHLELDGRIDKVALERVRRYLPLALLPELRDYLGQALLGGQGESLRLRLAGPLLDFPFADAEGKPSGGEFRVSAMLREARFDYVPWEVWMGEAPGQGARRRWPALAAIDGELRVDGRQLSLRKARARLADPALGQIALEAGEIEIPRLGPESRLGLRAKIRGPAAEWLRFIGATPVGDWLGGSLAEASATGELSGDLALQLPLHDIVRSTVRGHLQFGGGSLRLRPELPLIGALRGGLSFSEQGFTLQGAVGRALGGELTAEGGLPPGGRARIVLQGTATAEGLRRAPELGVWSRLASRLEGQTAWRTQLAWGPAGLDWDLSSSLLGLGAQLPAPLDKRADQAWPLRVRSRPLEGASPAQDWLSVDLGPAEGPPRLQARLLRETDAEGRILLRRSAFGLGVAAPEPRARGSAELRADRLVLDEWQAVQRLLSGAETVQVGGGLLPAQALPPLEAAAGRPPQDGPATPLGLSGLDRPPAQIELRAGELAWGARRLSGLKLSLSQGSGGEEGSWRARIEADQASGSLVWRPDLGPTGRLQARFDRLVLPQAEAEAVSELLGDAPAEGRDALPAVDLIAEDFVLRGKPLGRLEIQASQRAAESSWRLDRLSLATPEARLEAQGEWSLARPGGGGRRTELQIDLEARDGGRLLARLGQGEVLRGGSAKLSGKLGWRGSPLDFDHASLDGELKLSVGRGQFLRAEPGVGRLLGVLSLQSLPRRLLLDFRDVFAEGFSFDAMDGQVSIRQGIARTRNLRTRGPQALVLTEGEADLARETQDLRVWVVPEFNAGAASLAYAAINPAVGLGSFLAQWFLRQPLAEAGTRAFHVTGGWADPQVERLEQTPPTPQAGASDPAPARSTP